MLAIHKYTGLKRLLDKMFWIKTFKKIKVRRYVPNILSGTYIGNTITIFPGEDMVELNLLISSRCLLLDESNW